MIYIVEDDLDMGEIESYALKNAGYEVELFTTGAELYEGLKSKTPDLIILDIMLENESGIDILVNIRNNENNVSIPVIFVTAKNSEIEKVKVLDAGADDYITKPFGIMEFTSRVKAVLRRFNVTQVQKKKLLSCEKITMDESKREVMTDDKICVLTYKEFELLKYLILNKGIVLSRDKIMEKVWGFDFQGESRTVDMHIKTLRQKLGETGNVIKTVRNVGYKIG